MSNNTDVRAYADAARNQGKATVGQGRVALEQAAAAASVAVDQAASAAASAAVSAVENANKRLSSAIKFRPSAVTEPAYAAVGAADLVAETVTKRVEALPAQVLSNLIKAEETGKARLNQAQVDAVSRVVELRAKFDAGLVSAKDLRSADLSAKAKGVTESYLTLAKNLFDTLSTRGEARVNELRNEPLVSKLLGEVSGAADTVEARVRPVVSSVEARIRPVVSSVEARVSPVVEQVAGTVKAAAPSRPAVLGRKPAVGKAVVKKAPAKTASAKTAPAKTAPAKKAAAARATSAASPRKASSGPAKKATTAKKAPAKRTTTAAPAKATPTTTTPSA